LVSGYLPKVPQAMLQIRPPWVVHFAADLLVHFGPECLVHFTADYSVYPEETAGYAIQDGNCKLSNGSISNPKIL